MSQGTVSAGDGSDVIYTSGKNSFINAGDGKDVIIGFDDTDMLQITQGFKTVYNAANGNIRFTVGKDYLTLKNSTATLFNINGDSYKISGTKLVKN